ncbi:hypothetical protein STCU_03378 [Strigomonas culicis]|uniref:Archaic translocase of outer membrane 11 kDa subunit n=1 Tax=Strigomonas culicis TaxID=28005 RepID=S9UL48_9TRYP|nr:hypothetical protein STCU_04378 [Strigomonas culicis]EPY31592.1 hypothetical protein STCU_03378 [Strigomonas culicis]|eukprot:EPY29643.1 hypothetical protein STCU_04378 [Strigomonas culicis]
MFGRPQAPKKDWDELYFYEKVRHLIDHVSDFMVSKVNWWLPSVGVGMVVSLFVIGGPEAPVAAFSMASATLSPVVLTPPFATPEGAPSGPAPEEEEEF